ncbi:hypothetical protein BpHYR1_038870 [Brachionus plicatilis]|uniref:PDZ domain-containing protein n=1 Tax=Brachionus plicatilis TaxID=10195 RepID=A0A3M7R6B0_BRAPC|nr:hypothetical protein BpHYR1_038870 [Brachionus plicatilis]
MFNFFTNLKTLLNSEDKDSGHTMLNKHIRFDEDTDEEADQNDQLNKHEKKKETLNLNLVKIRSKREKSFGFELQGNSNAKGEHYIGSVDEDSPAGRVGLEKNDIIIKVNGNDVTHMNTNNLIDLLEYETDLNDNKLNLVICREKTDSKFSKRTLESKEETITKKRCEEKKWVEANTDVYLSDLNRSRSVEHLKAVQIDQVKFVSPDRFGKKVDVASKMILNAKAREIQMSLSKQGKYVSWAEVIYELLLMYQCEHIGELGLVQADNLEVINELIRVQKRIDNIIISSEIKVPFVCLLDLEQYIVTDYNHNAVRFNLQKIRDFDDLYVGPFIQNQIVRRIFKIPDQVTDKDEMKLITGSELLKYLVSYLRDNDLWSVKVKPADFEGYLIKKLKVQRIQDLGVRIINLGIIIGALKTVQHLYSENLKSVKLELESEISDFYKNEKMYLSKKLEKFSSNERYLHSDSTQVVCELLGLFENLLDKNEYYYINDFLGLIKESSYLRDCFQLAISLGKHELNTVISDIENKISDPDSTDFYHKYKTLLRRIFCLIVDKNSKNNRELKRIFNKFLREKGLKVVDFGHKKFTESESEPDEQPVNLQSKLEEFLEQKFEKNSTITLNHLKKIESHLFPDNKQNFIDLIEKSTNSFERLGLKLNLNESVEKHVPFDREQVLGYVDQLKRGLNYQTFDQNIEHLLLRRFCCLSIQDLGLGSLDEIIRDSESMANEHVLAVDSIFEPKLKERIDLNDLIQMAIACPFLADLYSHLDWSEQAVYYGKFCHFIKNLNKKSIQIKTLELTDNIHLKLDPNCSIESLKESIENLDAQKSASNLVSLICLRYKSMSHAPKSLISNEIQSSMATINDQNQLYNYITEFICMIPDICVPHIIFKFIIEPLVKIDSDHQVTKKIFHSAVTNQSNDRINWFVRLGNQLCIPDWSINSLENYQKLPAQPTTKNLDKNVETDQIDKVECFDEPLEVVTEKKKVIEKFEILNSTNEFGHVNCIRKRYGIGLELNEESRSVTESLTGVIGRSLQSLSSELYNKDMHFVLELIQNADDNSYVSQTSPTLVFLIEKNCITLFNNEMGFSSTNIDAICDVKASTKGAHHKGYIGRKGIGFKSVFTVTDRPEIHSNNYHIRFDLSNGHIGYILPEWCDTYEPVLCEQKNYINSLLGQKDFNTCIKLPLKSESEMQRHKSSLLTNNFSDIRPNLLLFLNRLRKLAILNQSGKSLVYERIDRDAHLVEIANIGDTVHKWFVIRDVIRVPESVRPAECVQSTELCLAFPLDDLNNLNRMDVFAYLPLRSFGFKFIIQADFVVPASRQDINQDNEWNQWLAKQIPSLFIKSLEKFKNHLFFQQDQLFYLTTFLKFIPLEDDILGFFQHVPKQIFDLLRNEKFLPAETESTGLVFKKPFECVIADECVRQVLSPDMVKKYSGRYYLSEELKFVDKKLLFKLGVQYLGMNELLELVEQAFTETMTDTKIIAKWLLVFQHCLNGSYSIQQEEKFIKKLSQMEIIPVVRHKKEAIRSEFVSLEKHTVFFNELNKLQIPEPLLNDLTFLNQEEILCLDPAKNNQIKQFLKSLGVKNLDMYQIVENHILRNLHQSCVDKSEDVLVSYMIFLYKSYTNMSLNFDVMAKNLPIKTSKGFRKLSEGAIYLTRPYGALYDLKSVLPSYNWTFVDEQYYKLCSDGSKKSEIKWKKFLSNLGLMECFIPVEKSSEIGDGLVAKDYHCEIVDFYVNLAKDTDDPSPALKEELGYLCKILEETWDLNFSSFKNSSLFKIDADFNSCRLESEAYAESNFFSKLKDTKWVPAELNSKIELMKPSSIYLKDQIIKGLYSNNVAYPITDLNEKSNFCRELGFKCEFNIDDFFSEFNKWTSSGIRFKASYTQMKNIYYYFSNCLNSLTNNVNLKDTMEKKFIFVPDVVEDDEEKEINGHFYPSDKVFCLICLEMENVTTCLSQDSTVSSIFNRLLPFIQSFIYHRDEFKDFINTQSEFISNKLSNLNFFSVKQLDNVYRLKNNPKICASISNKTYLDLDSSIFYVRSDCVDNLKDVVKGFVKGLTQGYISNKVEREMVNFCLLMYQFSDIKLKIEDKKEIEKDFGIKLSLPEQVEKWTLSGKKHKSLDIMPSTSVVSKRQNLLDLDQLSNNQMNVPVRQEFSVCDLSIQNVNKNLDQLEEKMKKNFSIKNLNEIEKVARSELSSIDMVLPGSNFSKKGLEYISKIGRLGELWVNEMLKHKFKNEIQSGKIRVEWINQEFETGLPYDFKIIHFGAENDGFGDSERFIEVKSTTKTNQEYFPISIKEILFAQKYASKFEIYRLYNVNCDDPNNVKLKVVRNVPDLLNSHGINLFIVI